MLLQHFSDNYRKSGFIIFSYSSRYYKINIFPVFREYIKTSSFTYMYIERKSRRLDFTIFDSVTALRPAFIILCYVDNIRLRRRACISHELIYTIRLSLRALNLYWKTV